MVKGKNTTKYYILFFPGDSLTGYNNNEDFSTRDRDNDDDPDYHYALNDDNSAWWYGGNDYYSYAGSVLNSGYHQSNKPS